MNPPTDLLPLQLWLAKQLSEEIEIRDEPQGQVSFFWKDEYRFDSSWFIVTPREWDYIVGRVEEKLTDNRSKHAYLQHLQFGAEGHDTFSVVSAPWPTRTIALMKVKGETE